MPQRRAPSQRHTFACAPNRHFPSAGSWPRPHPQEAACARRSAALPVVLAELLVARGITTAGEAFAFLNPEIAQLHDPSLMLGMKTAVERSKRAIARRNRSCSTATTTWTAPPPSSCLRPPLKCSAARFASMFPIACARATACNPAYSKPLTPRACASSSPSTPACAPSLKQKPRAPRPRSHHH